MVKINKILGFLFIIILSLSLINTVLATTSFQVGDIQVVGADGTIKGTLQDLGYRITDKDKLVIPVSCVVDDQACLDVDMFFFNDVSEGPFSDCSNLQDSADWDCNERDSAYPVRYDITKDEQYQNSKNYFDIKSFKNTKTDTLYIKDITPGYYYLGAEYYNTSYDDADEKGWMYPYKIYVEKSTEANPSTIIIDNCNNTVYDLSKYANTTFLITAPIRLNPGIHSCVTFTGSMNDCSKQNITIAGSGTFVFNEPDLNLSLISFPKTSTSVGGLTFKNFHIKIMSDNVKNFELIRWVHIGSFNFQHNIIKNISIINYGKNNNVSFIEQKAIQTYGSPTFGYCKIDHLKLINSIFQIAKNCISNPSWSSFCCNTFNNSIIFDVDFKRPFIKKYWQKNAYYYPSFSVCNFTNSVYLVDPDTYGYEVYDVTNNEYVPRGTVTLSEHGDIGLYNGLAINNFKNTITNIYGNFTDQDFDGKDDNLNIVQLWDPRIIKEAKQMFNISSSVETLKFNKNVYINKIKYFSNDNVKPHDNLIVVNDKNLSYYGASLQDDYFNNLYFFKWINFLSANSIILGSSSYLNGSLLPGMEDGIFKPIKFTDLKWNTAYTSNKWNSGMISVKDNDIINNIYVEKDNNNVHIPVISNDEDKLIQNVVIENSKFIRQDNIVHDDFNQLIKLLGSNIKIEHNVFTVSGSLQSAYELMKITSPNPQSNIVTLNNFTSTINNGKVNYIFTSSDDAMFYDNYVSSNYHITNVQDSKLINNGWVSYYNSLENKIYYWKIGNYYQGFSDTSQCDDSNNDGICDNPYVDGNYVDNRALSEYPFNPLQHLQTADRVVDLNNFDITIYVPKANDLVYNLQSKEDNLEFAFAENSQLPDLVCNYVINGNIAYTLTNITPNKIEAINLSGFDEGYYSFYVECYDNYIYKKSAIYDFYVNYPGGNEPPSNYTNSNGGSGSSSSNGSSSSGEGGIKIFTNGSVVNVGSLDLLSDLNDTSKTTDHIQSFLNSIGNVGGFFIILGIVMLFIFVIGFIFALLKLMIRRVL